MRPGLVIGRGGETIKELATVLEENFKVSNPQISVSEIEVPEMNAYVVGTRVASALQRGIHFRRAGFWALNQVMEAGALGAEIVISGKLRTERARFEKFRAGYFPRCGEPAIKYTHKAEVHVQLKAGMFGIRVKKMPPDAVFPDKIKITIKPPEEEQILPKTAPIEQAPTPTPAPMLSPAPLLQTPQEQQKETPTETTDAPETAETKQQGDTPINADSPN